MYWYIAKIVFQIKRQNIFASPQFDIQLRLITAANKEEATQKASNLGMIEEEELTDGQNQWLRWKFINVAELIEIPEPFDGQQLYSFTEEPENMVSYLAGLVLKSNLNFQNPRMSPTI